MHHFVVVSHKPLGEVLIRDKACEPIDARKVFKLRSAHANCKIGGKQTQSDKEQAADQCALGSASGDLVMACGQVIQVQ